MKACELFQNAKVLEFIRFCLVGVLATAIHYGVYLLLLKMLPIQGDFFISFFYSIGYLLGFVCNLYLSAYFTFKTKVTIQKSLGFILTNLVNYGLHLLFLNLFLWLSIPESWAPIPTFCCVIPINFILVRTVFKKLN